MPELPEVETLRRELAHALIGARIESVRVRWRKTVAVNGAGAGAVRRGFARTLAGTRLRGVDRRGKYLLLHLSRGLTLVTHLRMTGQLLLLPKETRSDRHTHVIFQLRGARSAARPSRAVAHPPGPMNLHFRDVRKFGRFILAETSRLDELPALANLGPDATEISPVEFTALLKSRKSRIKPLLLDQRRVAGLGNIYVDESLFAARLHPETPANEIPPATARALHRHIKRILRAAIAAGGTSMRNFLNTAGHRGRFIRRLKVYGRAGAPCPRCGTAIERIVVGGRGTHSCPACQRLRTKVKA